MIPTAMNLNNKTVVVTGAGSGIGREICLQLLPKQNRIAAVDINLDALKETQKIAKVDDDRFKAFALDITDRVKVGSLSDEVVKHFGAVDGLINNAGIIQKFIMVKDLSFEEIEKVINVNFYGTVNMTKAFLPLLLDRPDAHLVNVSSMGGFIPFPGQTIYGATKAAVKIFTEGLHAELKDTPVKVTVVHPGAVATNITQNSGMDQPQKKDKTSQTKKALSAGKAAGVIIKAIEKNRYRVTVGKDATYLDLLYRINPKMASNFIVKMMQKN